MAQLVRLSVLAICISLLHKSVISQPTSSATTASTTGTVTPAATAGTTVGGQVGGNGGLTGGVSSSSGIPGQSLTEVLTETASDLSKDSAAAMNGLASGVADALEGGTKFGAALSGTGGEISQIVGDKLGAFARLPSQVLLSGGTGSGGSLYPGFSGGSGTGFSLGGSGAGGGLNSGVLGRWSEGALQSLSALRPEQIEALARAGLLGAINIGDDTSGRFNVDVVQPWGRGAGDMFDVSMTNLGVQQPYGRQIADATWQMGENRRQDMMQGARDFASGRYRLPVLFGQGGGSSGSGSAGLSLGGLPGVSIQGQTGVA